jgi:hypothetical protein
MFKLLWNLRDALNAGNELKNAATWKRSDVAVKYLVSLLTIAVSLSPEMRGVVSDAQILQISTTVFTLVSVYSNYVHVATTKKLGM